MRAIGGLWRWRRNPLRRATDLAEAWMALAALLLILLAAPLIGVLVGGAAQGALQQAVRDQREARHLVTATVVKKLARSPLEPDPESASPREASSRVEAGWTGPDGTEQHGKVMANLKSPHPGDHFTLWTDEQGRIAPALWTLPRRRRTRSSPASVRPSCRPGSSRAVGDCSSGAWSVVGTPVGTRPGTGPDPTGAGPGPAVDRLPALVNPPCPRTLRWTGRHRAAPSATSRVPRGGGTAAPWHRARSR